ncbi:MAG: cbb3-type cytochrome c oxidase subunit II [Candidatus Eremiobacteraeota bacterium]|nr:cbb3-type cytochrome c oxidase subunit II [Candidatus Eremiobacteraeota bacterium]MCW5872391.1 cbb3-type cytochrome c oxidase subunit II [Candidatus Eremiobacteraeota bacterium]
MKKAYIFVFGASSTLLLSTFLFVIVPRLGQSEVVQEGRSAQLPYTEVQARGRAVYIEYGCIYCHSQQVRDPVAGADGHFGWGRPSRPSDYIYDRPHLLGTSRTGPDLSNIGLRQPSRDWHHLHLYNPRLLVPWSIMPGFPFLYRVVPGEQAPAEGAIEIPNSKGNWLLPSEKASSLVEYLTCLKRDGETP